MWRCRVLTMLQLLIQAQSESVQIHPDSCTLPVAEALSTIGPSKSLMHIQGSDSLWNMCRAAAGLTLSFAPLPRGLMLFANFAHSQ